MAIMWRVTARWTGGRIGTGFTNFFFTKGTGTSQQAVDSAAAFIKDSYGGVSAPYLPQGVSISWPNGIDEVESTTGVLLVTTSVAAPTTLAGGSNSAYASPAGACVSWLTGAVVDGRHVRGRTFLVPAASEGLQSDGTLSTGFVNAISTAATTFIAAAPEFLVWHRPESVAVADGSAHPVVAFRLTDQSAVLTSRR